MGGAAAQAAGPALAAMLQGRKYNWYSGRLGQLSAICLFCLLTQMTTGFDGSMMNGLQTLTYWQDYFGHPTGSLLGLFNAAQNIGSLAGLLFAAYISDTFGRRMGIFVGCGIVIVGVTLQSAAQSIGMFIGARVLIGFGLTQATNAAPMLLAELAFPTYRPSVTAMYNCSWYIGSLVAAWTTYGTFRINSNWGWRIPSIVQGAPSLIQMLFIFLIPESPRWLISKGKDEQAFAILVKFHCEGNHDDPFARFEMEEIKAALKLEQEATHGVTWKSMFQGHGNKRRTLLLAGIAIMSQCSGNGLVSYYLSSVLNGIGITSSGEQNLINGILQIWNVVTCISGALMISRIKRRTMIITGLSCMTVVFSVWTACSATYSKSVIDVDAAGNPLHPNTGAGRAVLAMIFIFYGLYNFCIDTLVFGYGVEILPFGLRGKGISFLLFCIYASSTFNQYVNPLGLEALAWKYYIIYCVFLLLETIFFYFFMVETNGASLEEISLIFDGKQDLIIPHQQEKVETAGSPIEVDEKSKGVLAADHVEESSYSK